MVSREMLQKKELLAMAELYAADPSLFAVPTWIDDAEFLERIGIFIPDHTLSPKAYLKFWPQDFIVEEVGLDGSISTVTRTNALQPSVMVPEARTIYATLVKCNLSTLEAVRELAGQLGCQEKDISYAGLKDKNAITAQRISIRNVDPQRIPKVQSPHFFLKDVEGGIGVVERGKLQGNRFTILLRTDGKLTDAERAQIASRLEWVGEHGFYNFYYSQRFGTPRFTNFHWGLSLLKRDFRDAVRSFLFEPGLRELPYSRVLRAQAKEGGENWNDVAKVFAPFGLHFAHELAVLDTLEREPASYREALHAIPDQVSLWVQSVSSYYFNKLLSLYIRLNRPLPDTLPVVLDRDARTFELYKFILSEKEWKQIDLRTLREFFKGAPSFPRIVTRDFVRFENLEVRPEGIVLRFVLKKGQYATTFLSHLFQLAGGRPFDAMSRDIVDLHALCGGDSVHDTFQYFDSVISAKDENKFDAVLK